MKTRLLSQFIHQVPMHWQAAVKAGLDRDVRLGVLEKVPVNDPVTWTSRMVITPKPDGGPRRVVDFQQLNKHSPPADTSHVFPLVNSLFYTSQQSQDYCRLLARISFCTITPSRPTPHYVLDTLGKISMQNNTPRFTECWGWLHTQKGRHNGGS